MEGSSLLLSHSCSSSPLHPILKPQFGLSSQLSSPSVGKYPLLTSILKCNLWAKNTALVFPCPRRISILRNSAAFAVEQEAPEKPNDPFSTSTTSSYSRDMLPKIDKSGRFCSPRAARELALLSPF